MTGIEQCADAAHESNGLNDTGDDKCADVSKLLDAIIAAQTAEISEMKALLEG